MVDELRDKIVHSISVADIHIIWYHARESQILWEISYSK